MKVCYVHTADFRKQRGSSIHVVELVKCLSQLHPITLLVDRWDGSSIQGVRFFELHCPRFLNTVWRILLSLVYLPRILRDVDLVYAKSPVDGSLAVLMGKLCRVPLIYEVNGFITEETQMKRESRIRVLISSLLERIVLMYSRHLVCVTPWIKEVLLKRGFPEEKLTVIENGADIHVFSPVANAKEKLHLSQKYYVGFIGTLKAWQGLDHLISAAPLIVERMPEVTFLIVGEGELKQWLIHTISEKGLRSRVVVTGEVSHAEIPLYISACDVCVLLKKPLSSGYSPLKLYEYLACERPVVASRVHGFECLEAEKAGLLVDQDNPEEVTGAVVALLKNEDLRREMGKRGRAFVVNAHTWEKVAQQVSEVANALKG